MTDKEKLHQILSSLWKNDDSDGKIYYNQALQDVQTAIDLQEESVSEELEKAADEYADEENPTCPCEECLIKTFKAGAQWQKKCLMQWLKVKLEEFVKKQYDSNDDPVYWGQRNAIQQVIDHLNKED